MTENRARAVEPPAGYDYPETDRIPVPGDLSDERPDTRPTDLDGHPADLDGHRSDLDGRDADLDGRPAEMDARSADLDAHPAEDAHLSEDPRTAEDARAAELGTPPAGVAVPEPATPVDDTDMRDVTTESGNGPAKNTEPDADFFADGAVDRFRDRWRELQAGFVDDPAQAVRGADDLVDEIMRELAERKEHLEGRWRDNTGKSADTEELRVVIREYRAFFDHLLNA